MRWWNRRTTREQPTTDHPGQRKEDIEKKEQDKKVDDLSRRLDDLEDMADLIERGGI